SVVGRHLTYATDSSWYQGCFDRLGVASRLTETATPNKAHQTLLAELNDGRPAVVWCARTMLPFLGDYQAPSAYWMHSFIVYGVDEEKGIVHGADRAPAAVTLTPDELKEARGGVCSHRNRTLTIDGPKSVAPAQAQSAVRDGIRAC